MVVGDDDGRALALRGHTRLLAAGGIVRSADGDHPVRPPNER
jgi:hypothetical protein